MKTCCVKLSVFLALVLAQLIQAQENTDFRCMVERLKAYGIPADRAENYTRTMEELELGERDIGEGGDISFGHIIFNLQRIGMSRDDQQKVHSCSTIFGRTGSHASCGEAPCQNGGVCTYRKNGVMKHICDCRAGFGNRRCDKDFCSPNPCGLNGKCFYTATSTRFICKCSKGFLGHLCERATNECASSPCQHGGVCHDGPLNYTCSCPLGFNGTHCQHQWLTRSAFQELTSGLTEQEKTRKSNLTSIAFKIAELRGNVKSNFTSIVDDIAELRGNMSTGGVTYTRWGHDACPTSASMVYKGFLAGSYHAHTGGGSNHLCLPFNPQYTKSASSSTLSLIYGGEYEPLNNVNSRGAAVDDRNVPCAVCDVASRSRVLMLPARNECPSAWTREYYGFLVADHHTHTKSEYVCVDREMRVLPGHTADEIGNLFYAVSVDCGHGGIDCTTYQASKPLTCSVCTK